VTELTTRIDEVSPTLTYIGKAAFGSLESDAVWQIKKLEKVGAVTAITIPYGMNNFNNVWDNRLSYTYL